MSVKKTASGATRQQKTKSRQTIAEKINLALGAYKISTDKSKFEKRLKKASKLLSKVVMIPMSKVTISKKTKAVVPAH